MSPEQATGQSDRIGPWTDVFGLGGLLYHLLTHGPLYRGASETSVIRQAREAGYLPIRQLAPSTPRGLARIVHRALAAEPERRYRNCRRAGGRPPAVSSPAAGSARSSSRSRWPRRPSRWRWHSPGSPVNRRAPRDPPSDSPDRRRCRRRCPRRRRLEDRRPRASRGSCRSASMRSGSSRRRAWARSASRRGRSALTTRWRSRLASTPRRSAT